MMFLELFVPRGRFGAEELRRLAERLTMKQLLTHIEAIRDVVGGAEDSSANPGVMDFLGSINHVIVHEIGTWIVDDRALGSAEPPRYVARAYVPGPWRKAMSAFLVASITRALSLADSLADAEPERCYREPCVEVQVIGVPEGGYGVFGRVVGESAMLDMIADAKTDTPAPDDPGVLIDPVCGMVASEMVSTLEHDGTTYGFCCAGCRKYFVDKLAAEASQ
ncbi:YHS domain-containing protein [Amycolatopsis taiwanensis]|uniref:YHS domain-containing protein n=1 Tax=Amycolatopsis taiwanensis TaxID=342230 RepID=UPI0004880EE5|nr:YHS domain-containing protein [Amycolatopsis taiwanensis]